MDKNDSTKRWQDLSKAIHHVDEVFNSMPSEEFIRSEFYRDDDPGKFYDSIDETMRYVDSEVERKMKGE